MKHGLARITTLWAACLVAATVGVGAPVRVSFLQDETSRDDTFQILREAGCPDSEIAVLERVMEHYDQTPFSYDTSRFPAAENGFYAFESISDFVRALSTHRLSNTDHPFEYNCIDTTVLIAGHATGVTDQFDAETGTYLAIQRTLDNREQPISASSLMDVYDIVYYPSFQEFRASISGRDEPIPYRAIAAALYQFHPLSLETEEYRLREMIHQRLQTHWKHCRIQFPDTMSIVLLHRTRIDRALFVTDHMGVLFRTASGFTYVEKAGGQGPFLRIDTDSVADIATYYATMASADCPFNFMTINDDQILDVPPLAPLFVSPIPKQKKNFTPVLIIVAALALTGALILAFWRSRYRWRWLMGLALVFIALLPGLWISPFLLWKFDTFRDWELSLSVNVSPYQVALVQKPGYDFYDTYFEIAREDGRVAHILVDPDDFRWWNPHIKCKDGKIYFLRGFGFITQRTPYLDLESGRIHSRLDEYTLSKLNFREVP